METARCQQHVTILHAQAASQQQTSNTSCSESCVSQSTTQEASRTETEINATESERQIQQVIVTACTYANIINKAYYYVNSNVNE